MKKLITMALMFFAGKMAYALPVGNPLEPALLCNPVFSGYYEWCEDLLPFDCSPFSVRVGYYGDFVWNRHMEIDEGPTDGAAIEHFEIYTNAAYFALNYCNRYDLFATFGATNMWLETNAQAFIQSTGSPPLDGPGPTIVIESDTDFSWSIGVRGILWQCCCFTIGGEVQYFYTRPDLRRETVHAREGSNVIIETSYDDDNDVSLKYREWQVSLGVAYELNYLIPYIAVKWGHSQGDMDRAMVCSNSDFETCLYNIESRKEWGYAVGTSFVPCDWIAVTVEGRFADEKALYVNGQIRF